VGGGPSDAPVAAVSSRGCLLRSGRAAGNGRWLGDIRWVDGRIESIGRGAAATEGEAGVDLDGAYVAPGLVDVHVHLSRGAPAGDQPGPLVNAAASLRAGITALRDLGGRPAPGLSSARWAAEVGLPRVVFAGRALTREGCYGGFLGVCVADGDDLAAQAEAEVAAGAGTLKVILTGPVDFAGSSVGPPHFSEPELRQAADVARRAGVPLAVHANGHEGVALALRVGVDSLEHGILLDERDLWMMAAEGSRWVPTLTPLFNLRDDPRWPGLARLCEQHLAAVARAREIGVMVVAGSDAGSPGVPHPSLFSELALLRRAGFAPAEAGEAAGSRAAALLGLREGYGRLQAGACTDVVWFARDPYAEDPGPPLGMLRVP
jgi:imidazolonepropionase-like amidohydrolase